MFFQCRSKLINQGMKVSIITTLSSEFCEHCEATYTSHCFTISIYCKTPQASIDSTNKNQLEGYNLPLKLKLKFLPGTFYKLKIECKSTKMFAKNLLTRKYTNICLLGRKEKQMLRRFILEVEPAIPLLLQIINIVRIPTRMAERVC